MAEGAIEGIASDYEMSDKFSTSFKYSRFDATAAKPRDISKMTGKRVMGKTTTTVGATPDVEPEKDEQLPAGASK